MKELLLRTGHIVFIDDKDFDWLNQWEWFFSCRYVKRSINKTTLPDKISQMHRLIMKPPIGMVVDHIDGNTLNNQKSNLRVCTQKQNVHNSKIRITNSSGYKGVSLYKKTGKYQCGIAIDGKRVHLGFFDDPMEASIVYQRKAVDLHGKYARFD